MSIQSPSHDVINAINEAKEELSPCLSRLNFERLSQYNRGYLRYATNPTKYFIDYEIVRYVKTIDFIHRSFPQDTSILDVGLFIPVIPIALAKLGFTVFAVEKLSFYDDALQEITSLIANKYPNITIYDLDILNDPIAKKFDLVLLLAVLEHLNGTPRYLLERIKHFLEPNGHLIIDVPNVANLTNRLNFLLKGKPPFPPFDDYYYSNYPFSGHNREYTIKNLEYALEQSGLEKIHLDVFHHSSHRGLPLKMRIIRLIENWGPQEWKHCIWTVARLK